MVRLHRSGVYVGGLEWERTGMEPPPDIRMDRVLIDWKVKYGKGMEEGKSSVLIVVHVVMWLGGESLDE